MSNDDLIRRLCEASEGSASLSREVWEVLTGETASRIELGVRGALYFYWNGQVRELACITTDLSAAWEEAERRGYNEIALTLCRGRYYSDVGNDDIARVSGECRTPALALCAALLAAEGER